MSLLEDVFLADEAGEAQELERIIEGDEYDERPPPDSDNNSEKEDEAEEDKRHVDPPSAKPKRVVKNPRVILNPARLTGPRGIQIIPEHFKDFKFKGKGHEKEDLDLVLKKLEHWAYRLYPKFEFKDCLKKMETLGSKRPVMVHLTKIRTDQFMSEDTVVQKDSSDEETEAAPPAPEEDEFDRLLQQQIELARTPGPGSARKGPPGLATPRVDKSLMMPKATSSPSISEEQKQRMLRNRQLAEERRLARLKLNNTGSNASLLENSTYNIPEKTFNNVSANNTSRDMSNTDLATNLKDNHNTNTSSTVMEDMEETIAKAKTNRSNVIDSSDDDDDGLVINEAVTVDVHSSRNDDKYNESDKETSSDKIRDTEKSDEIFENVKVVSNEELTDTAENVTEIFDDNVQRNVEDNPDIEMNDIGIVKESISQDSISNMISDKYQVNTEKYQNDHQNKSQNEVNAKTQECIDTDPTIVAKQTSGNAVVRDVSIDETETNKADEETNEVAMEDIMDVDFSDDF